MDLSVDTLFLFHVMNVECAMEMHGAFTIVMRSTGLMLGRRGLAYCVLSLP